LRKEIGSLSIVPLASEIPLDKTMTEWVRNSIHHPPIQLGNEIELKDALEDNQIVRCKNLEIDSNEVFVHIDAGKQVNKLNLIDERGVSFILNKDYTLKRIKFDSSVVDKNEDFIPEEREKKLEADFIIMTKILSDNFNTLIKITN